MSETLILLPGWATYEYSYKKLLKNAPDQWEAILFDYVAKTNAAHPDKIINGLVKFMDENEIEQARIFGHSLGGALSIYFAFHHPNRVKELLLANSEGIYGQEPIHQIAQVLLRANLNYWQVQPLAAVRSFLGVVRNPLISFELAMKAHHIDLKEEASKLKVPTKIIWADGDRVTPIEQGIQLHQLIPNSQLVRIPGLDHGWPSTHPELFWKNIV